MPRPQQGHRYSSSRGGIDLGGLLMAIYGGVEANPEFAEQGPTPSGLTVGQRAGPVKGKTIFDRADASRINADYQLGELEGASRAQREVQIHRDLLPIQLQQKQGETDIEVAGQEKKNKSKFELDEKGADNKFQREKLLSDYTTGNQVLGTNGFIPNDLIRNLYQSDINPEQVKALLSGLKAKMATNNATVADTERDQLVKSGTFPNLLATAQAKAGQDRQMVEGQDVSDLLQFQKLRREQELRAAEADLVRNRFMPGSAPIVDITTGKAAYTPPNEYETLLKNRPGLKPNTVPPAAAPQTGEMVEVVIDGVKVRIPKEAAARLSGAQ